MTQRSGTAARSVERYCVQPSMRLEGTNARKTHQARSCGVRFGSVSVGSWRAGGVAPGRLAASTPAPTVSRAKIANPPRQRAACSGSDQSRSMTKG